MSASGLASLRRKFIQLTEPDGRRARFRAADSGGREGAAEPLNNSTEGARAGDHSTLVFVSVVTWGVSERDEATRRENRSATALCWGWAFDKDHPPAEPAGG